MGEGRGDPARRTGELRRGSALYWNTPRCKYSQIRAPGASESSRLCHQTARGGCYIFLSRQPQSPQAPSAPPPTCAVVFGQAHFHLRRTCTCESQNSIELPRNIRRIALYSYRASRYSVAPWAVRLHALTPPTSAPGYSLWSRDIDRLSYKEIEQLLKRP